MSSVKVLTKKGKCCCKICLTGSMLINGNNVTATTAVAAPVAAALVPGMTVSPTGTYAHITYTATVVATAAGVVTHTLLVNGTVVATQSDEWLVADQDAERTISFTYLYTGPGPLTNVQVQWLATGTIATVAGTNRTLSVLSYK